MSPRRRARLIVWLRRFVQGALLLLFLGLLIAAGGNLPEAPGGAVDVWFRIDPLAQLGTWLAAHSLQGVSLLALITLALTVLLGRVFCGWICPLGTLHQAMSQLRRKARRARSAFSAWQRAKYYLLFVLLVMAVFGIHWIGVFDPIPFFYRSVSTALLPALQYGVDAGATAAYLGDPHLGPLHLTSLTEPVYRFCRDHLFTAGTAAFSGAGFILLLFLAAALLNLVRTRFWCRYVCPLGALLGLLAGRTSLRLHMDSSDCGNCGLCAMSCPAAAQPDKADEWLPQECFGCWNCVASCNSSALDFRFELPWRRPEAGQVDLSRRASLGAMAGGLGGLMLLRAGPQAQGQTYEPTLIRPPGARSEDEFLARCLRCGLCMEACPTGALHPTWMEAGLAGLWSPVMIAKLGYCDFECNRCGEVCPSEAIEPLDLPVKKEVKIGLARIDTTRCLPYAYGRECIVCEEHCPIPTKAIYFVEADVVLRDGSTRRLKQPRVDAELCTGCCICENKCPFEDRAAILVDSGGETRHPGNQPILPDAGGDYAY